MFSSILFCGLSECISVVHDITNNYVSVYVYDYFHDVNIDRLLISFLIAPILKKNQGFETSFRGSFLRGVGMYELTPFCKYRKIGMLT